MIVQDRIFKNLYGLGDWSIKGDMRRGGWYKVRLFLVHDGGGETTGRACH